MSSRPLLLFDGVCNLCHSTVRWVLARDKKNVFDFASLQSQVGRKYLERTWTSGDLPDSIVLIADDKALVRSDAALAIGLKLGFPWSLGIGLKIVPRPLRDMVYRWIARNRYRWFGKKQTCALPLPGQAARFLDAEEILRGQTTEGNSC